MNGNQFKAIREQLDLSQEELALVLGLSGKQAVSNIETGFRNASRLSMALMRIFVDLPERRSKELREMLLIHLKRQQSSLAKERK